MVIWIVGLSGSGKTTLSEEVATQARAGGRKIVLLDGDRIRELYGNDLGHDLVDRRVNADRICRLCAFLDEQGINVVCAILSIFPESRDWCRSNLSEYFEVFIDAPIEQVMERDAKGLYSRYQRGEIRKVAGLDLPFPRPTQADLTIQNDGSREALLGHAPFLVELLD